MSFLELSLDLLGIAGKRNASRAVHVLLSEEVDGVADRVERVFLPILLVAHLLHPLVQACQVLKVLLILMPAIELLRFLVERHFLCATERLGR